MKIAICDDEKEMRDSISEKVRRFMPQAEICCYESAPELLSEKEMPEILFLDIKMNEMDGMELARRLRARGEDVTIIFVTALEEYVYQAFDVGAFHYLVKPVDPAKFFEVLGKALSERRRRLQGGQEEEAGLTIRTKTQTQRVYLSEILYLEVFNRKVTLHKKDGALEFYGKLKNLEEQLGESFVRCHRAYIVNLRYVRRYDGAGITLENGVGVLMAKSKYAEFVRRYMAYISKREEAYRGTGNL